MSEDGRPGTPSEELPDGRLGNRVDPLRRAVRLRALLGRAVSGLLVVGAAGAVVAAGTVNPAVIGTPQPLPQVRVPAAVSTLVCPGQPRLATEPEPGDDVVYDPQFDPAPGESRTWVQAVSVRPHDTAESPASGGLTFLGEDDVVDGMVATADAAVAQISGAQGTVVVQSDPSGAWPAWSAGAVAVVTELGDLTGLVAASCQGAAPETWLVGGGTEVGSGARLVLQNPGRTAATVQVRLWGPTGPVEQAGAPEYLVPAGSERAVLLEGVAAEQPRLAIRLQASGGLVTAYLQDTRLRGVVPAGVDHVVAGRPPATRQVVTGLSVVDTPVGGADAALLRLLAPEAATTARVTLLGPDGPVPLPGTERVPLPRGAVLDLPLGGLPAGDYTAVVEAARPVVAGAMITRGPGVGQPDTGTLSSLPLERAWAPSVATGASGPLALPPGVTGRLTIAAVPDAGRTAAATVTLDVVGPGGAVLGSRELEVPATTVTALPLDDLLGTAGTGAGTADAAGVVLRTDDDRVAWGVVLVRPGPVDRPQETFVSVLAPVPPREPQPSVGVGVR